MLILPQIPETALQRIQDVSPRVVLLDARGWFDGELRASWPRWTADRYLGGRASPVTTIEQRKRALETAEIVLIGWPPLKDLRSRAPRLKSGPHASMVFLTAHGLMPPWLPPGVSLGPVSPAVIMR